MIITTVNSSLERLTFITVMLNPTKRHIVQCRIKWRVRLAHNLKVAGSNSPPPTKKIRKAQRKGCALIFSVTNLDAQCLRPQQLF